MSETVGEKPKAKRSNKWLLITILVGVSASAIGTYGHMTRYPKRFAPVVPGKLYRSGLVKSGHLERLKKDFGITRVISFLNPDSPECQLEKKEAEKLGIEWHNIPMKGNGASTPEAREQLLALYRIEKWPPTLVHCAAGTNRTGLAVGLYRIYYDGWTYEQVLEEMKSFDFEDLPKHKNLRQALKKAANLQR